MESEGRSPTKQQLIDEVCRLLAIGSFRVASGSTEPADFFRAVATAMRLDTSEAHSKPDMGRLIVESSGLVWDKDCDSRGSTSGGGSTVTVTGLQRICDSVREYVRTRQGETSFELNVRPEARALRLFKNLTFKAWYALGEFIDNSITSAVLNRNELERLADEDYVLRVEIDFDPLSNSLTINDNAAGIAMADLGRALRTSEPPPDTSKGLSLHGVGLKAAGFWWGEKITIETHPINEDCGWSVELDLSRFDDDAKDVVKVDRIDHRGVSGTRIRIDRLWNGVPRGRTLGAIRAFLPSIYRTFLGPRPSVHEPGYADRDAADLQLVLLLDGEPVTYQPPKLLTEMFWPSTDGPLSGSVPLEWQSDVEVVLTNGKSISGWIGILETMSRDVAGFALQYRGKSIAGIAANSEDEVASVSLERGAYKPRRIFGQPGSYTDQSFIGEFDLSAFGKSITTDSVTWTTEEEEEFVSGLYGFMRRPEMDFIAQATNLRRRKISTKAIESESEAISRETSLLVDSLSDAGIAHGNISDEFSGQNDRGDSHQLEDEGLQDEALYQIHDADGHVHGIALRFVNDPAREFLDIREHAEFGHHVTVNSGHKSISDLGPFEERIRSMLLRITLALASTEIFLEGTAIERSRFRGKLNSVLEARARYMRNRG